MTAIKICGLMRPADVAAVNEAGTDYAGFILAPSRRRLSLEAAQALRQALRPDCRAVGVFVDAPLDEIVEAYTRLSLDVIQLHGNEGEAEIAALRAALPSCEIWQAVCVAGPEDIARAEASSANLVLLDSGRGSGRRFDWALAATLNRPFALAGGLAPSTIPDAIARLRPRIVDLSSGVERDGAKDPQLIAAAVRAAHGAVDTQLQSAQPQ